jgi:hypothetical protein
MIGKSLKNAATAALGLVLAEKAGSLVSERIGGRLPGGEYALPAAMTLGGAYLGGRGGLLGKFGYGLALSGVLHLFGVMPGTGHLVDLNFEGGY